MDRLEHSGVGRSASPDAVAEETRHRLTLEALAEVDAGRTLSHAAVAAWAAGLATDHPTARLSK